MGAVKTLLQALFEHMKAFLSPILAPSVLINHSLLEWSAAYSVDESKIRIKKIKMGTAKAF
jgi:hypothetical protein